MIKKRPLKFALVMTMLIILVLSLCACGKNETAKKEEITVVAGNLYPVIYTNKDGKVTGFEHDVIEEIAKRSNLKVKWETSDDYTAMFAGLDSGKYTTIAGQVSYTKERAKTYKFSKKYTANKIRMCVRGNDPAKSVDDLQGRKVLIEYGTVLETFFNDYNAKLPDNKKIMTTTVTGSAYEALQANQVDAFPITVLAFDQAKKKGGYDFKLIGKPIIVDYQAFPFSKDTDPELVKKFNTALAEMQKDGTMTKLSKKYFNGKDFTKIDEK